MDPDKEVYLKAIAAIDFLVTEAVMRCEEVANDNHFEKDWVLEQFRNKFNQAMRQSKGD